MFLVSGVFIFAATRIFFYKVKSGASDIAQFVRFILFYVCILPVCICMCHKYAWCLQKSEEVVQSPGIEVIIDSCELLCECWEPKPCPLQEQQYS